MPDVLEQIEKSRIALARMRQGQSLDQGKLATLLEDMIGVIESSEGGKALLSAQREIRDLKIVNKRAVTACTAAYRSIARFPGSVHDHAMSKLDPIVHPDKQRVYPIDEMEAGLKAAETRRILHGLIALGVDVTDEIEALISGRSA